MAPKKEAPKKSGLLSRLKKVAGNETAFIMSEENTYQTRDHFTTGNIMLNCQISADPYKGALSGKIMTLAGPPSSAKTFLCKKLALQAQSQGYSIVLFDSEFANNNANEMTAIGLDPSQILWLGVDSIEDLNTQCVKILDEVGEDEKVAIIVDSFGNLSSAKELKDTESGEDKKDMTKQQKGKAFFRTCTLRAGKKQVPIWVIAHVYASMNPYGKSTQISGGTGPLYMSSTILELDKLLNKETKNEEGVVDKAKIKSTSAKNRLAKERQTVFFNIDFVNGLDMYSGLLEFCDENNVFEKVRGPAYNCPFTKKTYTESDLTPAVWDAILSSGLADYLRKFFAYQSSAEGILDETESAPELLEENE